MMLVGCWKLLFAVARVWLFVVRCVWLFGECSLSFAGCGVLRDVRCFAFLLFCGLMIVVCCLLCVVCCLCFGGVCCVFGVLWRLLFVVCCLLCAVVACSMCLACRSLVLFGVCCLFFDDCCL